MKQKVRTLFMTSLMVLGLTAAPLALCGSPVYAADPPAEPTNVNKSVTDGLKATGASNGKKLEGNIKLVVNVLLFLLGAIAVLMIIIGGIRYVLSNGESSQVTAAKNTIMYAVIGLIVALLAYAIVNFVVDQFAK